MANSKRKCASCKESTRTVDGIIKGISFYCNIECMKNYGIKNKAKGAKIREKSQKAKDKITLKKLKTRSAWYKRLERLVNQYVTKVLDVGKPCSTCGTMSEQQYDAGHYIAVGRNMDLRFELTNIHIQCSVQCNYFGRGMPVEYDAFIQKKYGMGHYYWLNTKFLCHKPHPTLKERFPVWQDIETEIDRYAILLKENGIKPNLKN